MRTQNVVVIGGTGFIGCHLLNRLAQDGFNTLVPARHYERAKHLTTLPYLDLEVADIHDDATLRRLLTGRDAVINLVGVLHGGQGNPYGPVSDACTSSCRATSSRPAPRWACRATCT